MSQFGFVGPAYQAANIGQDNQALINWFVEVDPNEPNPQSGDNNIAEAKVARALLGVPGLISLSSEFSGQEVRGFWVLPGQTQCLCVIGSNVVLASANGTHAITTTRVGSIFTSTGPVNIRDNGAGKIAVIVDGTTNLGVYKVDTHAFSNFTDPAYLGATNVAEIDGIFVFNRPLTQTFFTSPIYWDGVSPFDATFFALKDNASDYLVTLIEKNRELWLIGENTTEPWYVGGGATFPFSRIEGAMMQIGCAAPQSIAKTGKGLIWLGHSERGGNYVVMAQGGSYDFDVISSPAISWVLNQYTGGVADAIGYIYTEEGHEFYVLILPAQDMTWVYDLTTQLWHQRASFDPTTGLFHRQRVNCSANFNNMQIGGDYANGRIYWQTRKAFADDQYPLVALRRAGHVWDKNDRNRVNHARLQIDFLPGQGLSSGQGSDPQAMLRWSNDGGETWGNEHWTSIGQRGEYKNRAIWRRLGAARDRVYEVRISDPVSRDVAGASLQSAATGA